MFARLQLGYPIIF